MKILITDVTIMNNDMFCVAGWNEGRGRTLRPLPDGHHWPLDLMRRFEIDPGVTISAEPRGKPNSAYPHRFEDTPVHRGSIRVLARDFDDWLGTDAPHVSQTIAEAFDNKVKSDRLFRGILQAPYVEAGAGCASLAALNMPHENVKLLQEFGKLRAIVDDGANRYKLTVSSRGLKMLWQAGGIEAAIGSIPRRERLHVRIGLARAFKDVEKCYMMVNGIL